jgi:hypothetical protein
MKVRKTREGFARRLAELADGLEEMSNKGLKPPRLRQPWTKKMRELGIGQGG